jgi:hypothetical protein
MSATTCPAMPDGSARQCPTCLEDIPTGAAAARNRYGVFLHAACAPGHQPAPASSSAGPAPSASTAFPLVDMFARDLPASSGTPAAHADGGDDGRIHLPALSQEQRDENARAYRAARIKPETSK